jgi:hypothetical protein
VVILLLLLLLLLLFRKRNIKVRVVEAKEFTRTKDKATIWKYVCGYGEDKTVGMTDSTEIKAREGDTILVQPKDLIKKEDGSVSWAGAKVVKVVDEPPDDEKHILDRAKPEN